MAKNIRIAILDKDKCQHKNCNYLCKRMCPGVRMGEDTIVVDETNKFPLINEELCTGCGICANRCPYGAIDIINVGIEFDAPLHQYGENQFRLYSLPITQKGHVTGIIGRNGVGKTTAFNILSGNLNPNFGDYNKKNSIDDTIEYFRGKSIQSHFEDLKDNKVDIGYKIQKVEDIPKMFNKKISDLLNSITNNKEDIELIIKELELEKIINKTPQEISGGELQRVAIAATLLKDANLYFFDEYSTFLDIRQRFKIAKVLNKKQSQDNSIILIEHDLAILDYLSDFIQVMYGKKNAYGVCSNKKSTKKGINEFLDGFLKEENTRIRNYKIEFSSIKEEGSEKGNIFIEYPSLEKKLGSFNLNVNKGGIKQGEIIGILGPNAIGKTTFIKMLAGELEADNTKLDLNLKIAYKPQYINYDSDIIVRDLFFNNKEIDSDLFNSDLKNQLDLETLFDQKVSQLSGGELQKVTIAHCLCKKADLYLIDEPSAFLDVELRLIVANTIKKIITKNEKAALIVDHDLLFLDYISDRIQLFEGESSVYGKANDIDNIAISFNKFLKTQNITFRQDPETKRPRANKPDSQKDQIQKKEDKYYYTI